MNEHGFIQAVHRMLPKEVYKWKIADRYTAGIPDCMYITDSGRIVFVEYKYLKVLPRTLKPLATELQQYWLTQRANQNVKVALVVGVGKQTLILINHEWSQTFTRDELSNKLQPRSAIIEFITDETTILPSMPSIPLDICHEEKR